MEGLTAHAMVRNEPFVWYSVRSVYAHVSKILLWDTGSDDATLSDIEDLLKLDVDKKIDFRQVPIQTDERYWNNENWKDHQRRNKGKRGTGWVRQQMINETETDFFLILDGDEVWYPAGLRQLQRFMRRARHVDAIVCARVPLRWFCDMTTWFKLSESGRIFKTDRVVMYQESPGEMHMDKRNPGPNSLERVGDKVQQIKLEPYAHYETMLKPWRRTIPPQSRKPWRLDRHPSVFAQEPKYLDRFLGIKRAAEEAKKRKVSMSVRDRVRLAKRGMKNVKKLRTR